MKTTTAMLGILLLTFSTAFAGELPRPGESARSTVKWKENVSANPVKIDRVHPFEQGFQEVEKGVYACENKTGREASGVSSSITLRQKTVYPIFASLASKAEKVDGISNSDYSIYVDLLYVDGSHEYGLASPFSVGTHDWETRRLTILPTKPVQSLSMYGLFRYHSGKVLFKDFYLAEYKAMSGLVTFDGIPTASTTKEYPNRYFQIRNVAAASDFVYLGTPDSGQKEGNAFDVSVKWDCRKTALAEFYTINLASKTEEDRALSFHFIERLPKGELVWCADPRRTVQVVSPLEYVNARVNPVGSSGRLSRYPFGAVVAGNQGIAIGIAPEWPGFYRVACHSASRELYIGYDIALTKEKPTAQLTFVRFSFDPTWEFRGALEKYYQLFPDSFKCRIRDQGTWMPFHPISKVKGYEDFGFKFKEGNDEVDWDDAHDIITFRYTEPLTWWMSMPKDMPRTMDAALKEAKRLAEKGNKMGQALFTCGFYNVDGNLCARLVNTPWTKGAVWSFCDAPGLGQLVKEGKIEYSDKYPVNSYGLKWSKEIGDKLYPAEQTGKKGLDGEYIDSSEGYITALLNYRREHFAGVRCPLVFDRETFKPAILRGLVSYEYTKVMADDVHARGKLMMANATPMALFWLAPLLDVCGTETDWNYRGKWSPMSDADLLYRRAMCRQKPYCFLMNTDFSKFPYEYSEKFMKRSLAYGHFPGYFSADASTGHYFSRPELYDRDRPLFKKYIPLCKKVAMAGWQPITGAKTDSEKVYVERFGNQTDNVCLTLFNDSDKAVTAKVSLDAERLKLIGGNLTELLSGKKIEIKNGSFSWTIHPEDVAVFTRP